MTKPEVMPLLSKRSMIFAFLASLAVANLSGQTFTGSISGRVVDGNGAAMPNVNVELTELSTNAVIKGSTNEAGEYVLPFLKPSEYSATFRYQGFKEQVQTGLLLQLNQKLRLDVQMAVGEVHDHVTVEAEATELQMDSPEVGHVVEKERLANIPLIASGSRGRSPLLLAKLEPGVSSTNYGNINNFSFGGGRPETNEILVDGLPTTNPSDNTYTLTPSPESVHEFKVLTFPFSAEYGHTGGGVMMLTSNAGGNAFHGSAYDYFRNRVLNGRNFFAPTASNVKFVQNDPGGNASGPVLLPFYNGRNRTFFFSDFNVALSSQGSIISQLVPTAAERTGDFSQTQVGSAALAIYDPTTTKVAPDGQSYTRALFPGARIPASRLDAVGSKIASFYPNPNGLFAGGMNYQITPSKYQRSWQWLERVDHNFGDSDRMFARVGGYHPSTDAQVIIPNKANNDTASGWYDFQAVISETHIFNPRIVSDFRVGFVQEKNYDIAGGAAVPELGLKGVPLDSFPIVSSDAYIQLGSNPSDHDRDRSYVLSEAVTWLKGRHSLKMGGDYRRQMWNNYSPGKLSGSYSFDSTFTSIPTDSNSGYGLASLLLGIPTSTAFQTDDYTYRLNINSGGLYLQDDVKVSSRLALNLGLRWEYDGPYSEANNQFASFNPTKINAQTGTPGDVEFAGRNGAPTHFMPNIYHNFLPRVGFAYHLFPNTVLRGGYGIFRLPNIGFGSYGPISKYGVNQTFNPLGNGTQPYYTFQDGVPARQYNIDADGNPMIPADLSTPTGAVVSLDRRTRTPYNQNWSFGVQHQIGGWFVEVNYAASKGTKLPTVLYLNQTRPELWSLAPKLSDRPFPQYASVQALYNDGSSTYHSMQATLKHRFTSGFLFEAGYTFSKLINNVDAADRANRAGVQDIYNLRAERGIGGYDQPQRFVASYVWDVPLGRGARYLKDVPVLKDALGGWQLAGLTEYYVGLPMQIKQRTNRLGGYNEVQRPDRISDPNLPGDQRSLQRWFDTSAFANSAALVPGTSPRFPLHAPGVANWDLALQRNIQVAEHVRAQLRGEFFNAMNHANFSAPGNTLGTSNFGAITGAGSPRNIELVLRLFF